MAHVPAADVQTVQMNTCRFRCVHVNGGSSFRTEFVAERCAEAAGASTFDHDWVTGGKLG